MLEEVFQQGSSLLHQADPRAKIVCASFLALTVATLHDVSVALGALCIGCLFIVIAKLPICRVMKRLLFVNTFVAFLWIFLPFSMPGRTVFYFWKWAATIEGIKLALLITFKCNAMLMIIISFIATTPVPLLGYALTSLRFPRKLILVMLISYRYIEVISKEYQRISEAAKVRCFVPKNNLHTYRTFAYILAMVFIRSYERGVRVYQAMLLRGFSGRFYSLHRFDFGRRDLALSLGSGLCAVILFGMDHISSISRIF